MLNNKDLNEEFRMIQKNKRKMAKTSIKKSKGKKKTGWCSCKEPIFHPIVGVYCLQCNKLIRLPDDSYF